MNKFENSIDVGKNVYPNISGEELSRINSILNKKYNSELELLFDDGIRIKYGEEIYPSTSPSDLSFFWVGTHDMCYNISILFESVVFSDVDGNTIIEIPIL